MKRNVGKIRFLNTDTTKSAIVSLAVTSRLVYCNGPLCGITEELLCRLQKVQNNAARVVSGYTMLLYVFIFIEVWIINVRLFSHKLYN